MTNRDELNDGRRNSSLKEDLVGEIVGVGSHRRRLPENDVSDDGRRADEVSSDSSLEKS